MTLPAIDTAQVHVWQGQTLEGNASTSAGMFLTPFATGPVDAIVSVHVNLNSPNGVNIPVLFAVSDGRGNNFYAIANLSWLDGGGLDVFFDVTFRVTSAQLYFALWTEGGTTPLFHEFVNRSKLDQNLNKTNI